MAILAKPVGSSAPPGGPSNEGLPEDAEPVKAASPALTRDDISGIVRETATAVAESMRAVVQSAMRPGPAASPAEAPIPDASDDEINAAIASGEQPARLVRRLAEAAAARAARHLRDTEVAPFREAGQASLAKLVRRNAIALMPKYERFKPQIDATLDAMEKNNPAALLDIDNLLHVHNLIVGQNIDAIEKDAREAALRKPDPADEPITPGRTGGRRRPPEAPTTVEDVLPDAALAALGDLGAKGRGGRPVGKSFEEFVEALPPYETRDEHGKRVRKRWTPDEYLAALSEGAVETEGEA